MSPPSPCSVIPLPNKVDFRQGTFQLLEETIIQADDQNQWNAIYLQGAIRSQTGYTLPVEPESKVKKSRIHLGIDKNLGLPHEGYQLAISQDDVFIKANDKTGIFYGIQTFRQMLPVKPEDQRLILIPSLEIQDWPNFSWRGLMLDEGRYFHGKATVLRLLDAMAILKMNVFHWHLTEDQGWRLEIKKYPRLTEIGSQRSGTAQTLTQMLRNQHDGIPQGGFYTQDEVRQIIVYAQERHIMIVPEIEMPGHATAALAAYPELSCMGGKTVPATRFGIFKDVMCPGKDNTFEFLEDILLEVIKLFPAPYIHIGGDEAPRSRWKACPDCQRRITEKGLKGEHELQPYFTNRIASFLEKHNRTLIGWNEILSTDLQLNAIAQYWIGNRKVLIEAIRQGRKVIHSSYLHYYLDHSYSLTSLNKAYNFYPEFAELTNVESRNILGVEAPIWSEFIPNWARLEYQAFPRLLAVAETGWTFKSLKNYPDFLNRYRQLIPRLQEMGIRCPKEVEVEPGRLKQAFGLLSIFLPQRKTT